MGDDIGDDSDVGRDSLLVGVEGGLKKKQEQTRFRIIGYGGRDTYSSGPDPNDKPDDDAGVGTTLTLGSVAGCVNDGSRAVEDIGKANKGDCL